MTPPATPALPVPMVTTPDVRALPLVRLSASPAGTLRRVVPAQGSPKPPTAAFDSAL